MHFVPQSDPISNNVTRVINNLELPAGETFTFDSERIVLEVGDRLVFQADPEYAFPVAANTMVNGKVYKIVTAGSTNFISFGAANNNPGTVFTMANSPAAGDGEVELLGYTSLAATVSYLEV
jgi:hypothetical protein